MVWCLRYASIAEPGSVVVGAGGLAVGASGVVEEDAKSAVASFVSTDVTGEDLGADMPLIPVAVLR